MEPILIEDVRKFEDNRGFFYESYKQSMINESFVQDNHSLSKKNTIRGLHYQWDKPMGKLVRVAQGEIMDVVTDVRKDSGNFGKSYYYQLSDKNLKQLFVPPGFAHGFICRSETAIVLYKCTSEYNKFGESGINPFDEDLNIDWGIKLEESVISQKDLESKSFSEYILKPKF